MKPIQSSPDRGGGTHASAHAAAAVALTAVLVGLTACESTRPVAPAPRAPAAVVGAGASGPGPAIPGGAFASLDGAVCPVSFLPPGVSADPFPGFGGLGLSTTGYPIFDIGPLAGGQPSFAYDVNDATPRQVVGGSLQPEGWRAFAWTEPGGFTNLGTLPGHAQSFAQGNNDFNQVVGYSASSAGQRVGFKWTSGGGMVALASLPGGSYGDAWDINESGQIAGWSRVNADDDHATLWSPAGVPQDLGTLPGGSKSYAYDVSNAGHVVGYGFSTNGQRAFRWTAAGGMQDLGLLPGAIYTRAMGVNDLGQVVGYALMLTGNYRAFYWSPSTGMIDIGSLGGVATQDAVAWDINNAGQVTGYSRTSTTGGGGEVLAFVWTRAGGMYSLGKHPSSCSSYGYGMNNTGYVAGSDEFSGLGLGNRSALWTAAPATGQIGDYTWIDANGNGRQDAGEPALAGVTLTLAGAASGTQVSSAAGAYLFAGLPGGAFTVTATPPAGWMATTASAPGTTGANDSNASPASVTLPTWSSQNLTIDFGFVPTPGAGQGCTPGYWKQQQHFDSWKWYAPTDMLDAVFGVTYASQLKNNPSGPLTLLQALELNGNDDSEALFRVGTAALLNSVYQSGVSFPYTAPQVLSMVRAAWQSDDKSIQNATKNLLDAANNAHCPLN